MITMEEGRRGKLFGTDGIRGVANQELTPELAFQVGFSIVKLLSRDISQPRIIVGRDTRCSGEMLEAALSAGVAAAGGRVELLGILPTPGVALLTRKWGADASVVISASHNPVEDNGIKIFYSDGFKLSDDLEEEIEKEMETFSQASQLRPTGERVGRIISHNEGLMDYVEALLEMAGVDLSGKKVVLDCAHGASYQAAPRVFTSCGAEVMTFFNQPDGYNINAGCGSIYPERLSELVIREGADIGFTFDGDADRVLAADEEGRILNGDVIMALCAFHMQEKNNLRGNAVVATVMSNKGFHQALRERNIEVFITPVGDRYVLEEMRTRGLNLGGEQSGHIIFLDHSPSGDGLLTALRLCGLWVESGRKLSELSKTVPVFPQVLVNVRAPRKDILQTSKAVERKVREVEALLGEKGRVLIRPSGTEQLIRVMVEAPTEEEAEVIASDLASLVERELGV